MRLKFALLFGGAMLAGCDGVNVNSTSSPSECFIISIPTTSPSSPILLDKCTGKTWLLVRTTLGAKPEDGFTYKWHILDQIDWPPVLTRGVN